MKTLTYKLSFFVLLSGLFFGCGKGPQGPAGADGNANVLSHLFVVSPSAWYISGSSLMVDLSTSLLTDYIINEGAVLVFVEATDANNVWQAMPYTWPSTNEYWGFWCEKGLVTIEINDGSGTVPAKPSGNTTFKVVAIDGFAAMTNGAKELAKAQVMLQMKNGSL